MARHGARFAVLKHPFLSDWLKRLNVGKGTKISPRHVILYNALFSLSPRNPRIISYSLRVDARSTQHKVPVKLHCEHDDSLLGLFVKLRKFTRLGKSFTRHFATRRWDQSTH